MNKINEALKKNATFPLLTMLICAAAFAGGHMFVKYGYGLFNEIAQAEMIRNGMNTGDYSTPIGYCTGFLLARIMEGPLVGIMDIGGSIMTGVGTGFVSLFMASGLDWVVDSFALSLLAGGVIGLLIGIIVIVVKKAMPSGMAASGTNIMMGAGNASGRYFGPLIILSAVSYSIPAGIGAIIGSVIFIKIGKPMVGGTILGALLLALLFPVVA